MKKRNIAGITIAIALVGILVYGYYNNWFTGQGVVTQNEVATQETDVTESQKVEEPVTMAEPLLGLEEKSSRDIREARENVLTLRSVGDLLMHNTVSFAGDTSTSRWQAKQAELDQREMLIGYEDVEHDLGLKEYDYRPLVSEVAPYTSFADVTVANLEVIAAYPTYPITGYPSFNTPASLLTSMEGIGIDIVNNATNHTLDYSKQGAYESIKNLQASGLEYVGSYDSGEDQKRDRIIEANGINLGFLSYTYGTNGVPIPDGEEYLVSMLDEAKMVEEIKALDEKVDAVVLVVQVGEEYDPIPNDYQRQIFQAASDAGARLILGGHPHVLQPVEWFNNDQTFAIYSQASFMSGQLDAENKQGSITEVSFYKDDNGEIRVDDAKVMPIFILGDWQEDGQLYQTVPMADYAKYDIPDGEYWFNHLEERMTHFTDNFDYVTHLETEMTEESLDTFR